MVLLQNFDLWLTLKKGDEQWPKAVGSWCGPESVDKTIGFELMGTQKGASIVEYGMRISDHRF